MALIQTLALLGAKEKARYSSSYTSCIIVTHDHQLLLQNRIGDFQKFARSIAAFGGKIESTETPEHAIQRELNEELGAEVNLSDLIFISAYTEAVTQFTDVIYGYFWYDKYHTITGCFEGNPLYYQNSDEVLQQPQVMDDVKWLLGQCQQRQLHEIFNPNIS